MYPPAQGYSPARSAFEDIRIGDYTRDGTAAVLLFVSFFLPWSATVAITRVGSSALVVLLVLPTLLSLVSLSLPYVARLGMLGPNWNVGQIRVLRLVANGPLIATVVGLVVYDVIRGMFRFSESSSVFTGNGVGAGAWFGLAGALLAAQPRAAEIRIDARTAPRWLALVKPLVFVAWGSSVASALLALIYILVSASRYRYYDGPQTFESLIVLFVSSAVPIVVVGVAAVGLARRFASWRLTIAALGIALLAAGLLHSISEGTSVELFHTATASPYYGITFLIAAAAITFIPFGVASVGDGTHPGYAWLAAARNGMLLIAVWSFGVGFSQIAMAATQFGIVPWGDALVLAVLAILFGILAVVGVRSLSLRYSSLDPRPSREVGLGVCVGLLVLMIARLVVQSAMYGEIYYSAWIFDLAMAVLVVLVALALTVSPAVRNLYAGVQLFASATTVTAAVPNLGQPVQRSRRALEAADPRTPAAVLFEIASSSPELRPAIAANPSTYDDLVTWLEALGDPAVDAALDRRAAGQFGLLGPEPEPATETFISSGPEARSSGDLVQPSAPRPAVPQFAVPQPNPGYGPTGVPLLPGGFRPAGAGIRVAARFIDFAILAVVSVVGGMISTATLGNGFDFDSYRTSSGLIGLLIGIGSIVYFIWGESAFGVTLGKLALGIGVRSVGGARPALAQSFKRNAFVIPMYFGSAVSALAMLGSGDELVGMLNSMSLGSVASILGSLVTVAISIAIIVSISSAPDVRGFHDRMADAAVVVTRQ
ncbi:RDD family protein [Rhodococcus erythropolis]|uniref:RDD family protein n=1 Tax=Rhodococcus erythropolis TaxID=1833 RepID=A0A6G9CM64_RHOER|nr:RDD family protein [Rhodococcus erythropolis]